jgi:catechol 2,3-dioxygenase-like lactoylglutathione lyase family enzyme
MRTDKTIILGMQLFVAAFCALSICGTRAAAADRIDIPKLMLQPSVNLVLSVADVDKSKHFYGEVLGLKPMANLNLPGGFVMTRYQVGTTEIKLLHLDSTEKTETGPFDKAVGIRRLSLFFPDAQALIDRFKTDGRPAPEFETEPTPRCWSRAVVSDPDGNEIELIVTAPGTPKKALGNIELRLTVGDLEKSRTFYREFVGFEELDPVDVPPAEGGTLYGYRHGNTTIVLASFGAELPKHSGRWQNAHGMRYIQYIVRDLDAVNEFAQAAGVTIDQPIFPLGKLARIMFIADPDGIINEFVGLPVAGK